MKAIAVVPGKPDSVHLAEMPRPSVDEVPGGRGVRIRFMTAATDFGRRLREGHSANRGDRHRQAGRRSGGDRGGSPRAAQALAQAVEHAMKAEGTFVAMNNRVSQSVPHLHVHVVPRRRKDGLKGFFWPRTKYKNEEEMLAIKKLFAQKIKHTEI